MSSQLQFLEIFPAVHKVRCVSGDYVRKQQRRVSTLEELEKDLKAAIVEAKAASDEHAFASRLVIAAKITLFICDRTFEYTSKAILTPLGDTVIGGSYDYMKIAAESAVKRSISNAATKAAEREIKKASVGRAQKRVPHYKTAIGDLATVATIAQDIIEIAAEFGELKHGASGIESSRKGLEKQLDRISASIASLRQELEGAAVCDSQPIMSRKR